MNNRVVPKALSNMNTLELFHHLVVTPKKMKHDKVPPSKKVANLMASLVLVDLGRVERRDLQKDPPPERSNTEQGLMVVLIS